MKTQKIKSDVFFISPDGEIVPVYEGKHINAIIKFPKVFGFSNGELEKLYRKHDEDMGFEGNAREEIMIRVISQGWIRVRFIPKYGQFIFQIWKPTERIKRNIWEFLVGLKTKTITASYPIANPDIVILDTVSNVVASGELREVMVQLSESKRKPRIKQLYDFEDFTFTEYLKE